jgi:hypothetical protein
MRRGGLLLPLVCLLSAGESYSAEPKPKAESQAGAAAESTTGPVYRYTVATPRQSLSLAVELMIDYRSPEPRWRTFLEELFGYFDRNADGRLDAAEAAACPTAPALRRHLRGEFLAVADDQAMPPPGADQLPAAEGLGRAEFVERSLKLGLARPEIIRRSDRDDLELRLQRRLFALLADETGAWTRESLARASEVLARYDADGDERISFAELAVDRHRWPADDEPQVEVRYERPTERTDERPGEKPPQQGASSSEQTNPPLLVDVGAPESAAADGVRLRDGLMVTAGVFRGGAGKYSGDADEQLRSARAELLQQWEADDADADGALSADEIRFSPLADAWRTLQTVVPATGNQAKSLLKADWKHYLDLLDNAASLRVEARWRDYGRYFTWLLDADGDRALSPRELADAWRRLEERPEELRGIRDGRLRWTDIPRLVDIRFSLGAPDTRENQTATSPPKPNAPKWFTAMDRNADREVSRREFLGKPADFKKLDADADGLISAEEAR